MTADQIYTSWLEWNADCPVTSAHVPSGVISC